MTLFENRSAVFFTRAGQAGGGLGSGPFRPGQGMPEAFLPLVRVLDVVEFPPCLLSIRQHVGDSRPVLAYQAADEVQPGFDPVQFGRVEFEADRRSAARPHVLQFVQRGFHPFGQARRRLHIPPGSR